MPRAVLRAEIGRLQEEQALMRRWQDEAMVVLLQWDCCYDLLASHGHEAPLGTFKAQYVYSFLEKTLGVTA